MPESENLMQTVHAFEDRLFFNRTDWFIETMEINKIYKRRQLVRDVTGRWRKALHSCACLYLWEDICESPNTAY